jgi:flavin reductase (DIM6/NTAB) family NADH-FMN oxidoreductase RutF
MEGILGQLGGKEVIVDPATTEVRNVYKLMVAAIVPRPIAFVSTIGADGILNLAPFSFFTAASADPPVICFAPMIRANAERDGGRKDTLRNIQATGEFVVNIVSEEFAAQMNICSAEFPPEIDEFQASGLTPVPSDLVRPPRVKESHVHMECRLLEIVNVSAKPLGGWTRTSSEPSAAWAALPIPAPPTALNWCGPQYNPEWSNACSPQPPT